MVIGVVMVLAQITPDREIETVKFLYEAGNYTLAREHVADALRVGTLTVDQRIELLKYGGLSAFELHDLRGAEEDFLALLKLNPDYVLDPAAALFEELKSRKAKRSLIPNFVPFGVGQLVQGRTGWGVAFAVSEGVLGVTSLIAYLAIEMLFQNVTKSVVDLSGSSTYSVRQIPAERASDYGAWNVVKLSSGIAFYALAAIGILDALWHHEGGQP